MAIQLWINNGSGYVDYSKYIVDGSVTVEELLNQPTVTNFTLSNFDNVFSLPKRSSYVRLISTKYSRTLATGFITQEPERTYIGPGGPATGGSKQHRLAYQFQVTSDEWLLNVKTVPFIPAFVNQTMGQILKRLANALVPAQPGFFGFDVDDGDIVPFYKYDPKQMWSEIAKTFGDSIHYRYKVMDHVITFKPYNDKYLGVYYDDSSTRLKSHSFDPQGLRTTILSTPVINDAIVIGDVEPRSYVEDHFIGDGLQTDYTLRHRVFRGSSSLLLEEQWSGTSFSKDLWDVVDPDGSFQLAGALNVLPKPPKTLGSAYVLGQNGIELGGHLNLQHGEVAFTSVSGSGLIGGVYSSPALTLANCLMGFMVTGGNIRPVVNGQLRPVLSTIQTNKNYLLQTIVDAGRWSRYDKVYRTLAGDTLGGTTIAATTDVTFLIEEIPVASPGVDSVIKKSTNEIIPSVPSFGLYSPVNSIDLQAAITFTQISQPPQGKLMVRSLRGPTGSELPTRPENLTAEEKYLLGFGLENQTATLQENQDIQQLRFYPDTIPGAGARIRLRSWEAGRAVGRVRDTVSVSAEAVVSGDDGVRSAIVSDMVPLPRTSEECELAGKAFITDRVNTQYNGSYSFQNEFWEQTFLAIPTFLLGVSASGARVDYPRPGRYFRIRSPMRGIEDKDYVVRRVQMQIGRQDIEKIFFNIEFGPDLYVNKLLQKFLQPKENILLPKDSAERPVIQSFDDIGLTFLGDLPDATITNVTGTQVSIDLGQIPVTGAEIRKVDSGWGRNDGNRITVSTTQTLTLQRSSYEETFYIRQINGPKTSRYTTKLHVVYPQPPISPTGVLDTRDWLKPEIMLNLTGDIRNIHGIEIRSCMASVSGASVTGATVTGAPATGAVNIENPMECLDLGLVGTDPSQGNTPVSSQNYFTKKKFTRSEFLFDPTLYDEGTRFYFEAVVTNTSYTITREIYIEKQMRGRTPSDPIMVQTLTVPPQVHRKRIRFSDEFLGYQYETLPPTVTGPVSPTGQLDYTDSYRVWMESEAPPVLVYPASTIFPDSPFELHKLRIIAISKGARRTVIDIPLSNQEGESSNDVGQSQRATTSNIYENIPSSSIWTYKSSEWDFIKTARFMATMSTPSVSGSVVCGLYDIDSDQTIAEAVFQPSVFGAEAATVQTNFGASGLIHNHRYTPRLKVTSPAVTGHFYKASLRLALDPIRKANVYWRFGAGNGREPFKVTDLGITTNRPGTIDSRLLFNPEQLERIKDMFVEVTAGSITGSRLEGCQFDWPGYFFDSFNYTAHAQYPDAVMSPYWNIDTGASVLNTGYTVDVGSGTLDVNADHKAYLEPNCLAALVFQVIQVDILQNGFQSDPIGGSPQVPSYGGGPMGMAFTFLDNVYGYRLDIYNGYPIGTTGDFRHSINVDLRRDRPSELPVTPATQLTSSSIGSGYVTTGGSGSNPDNWNTSPVTARITITPGVSSNRIEVFVHTIYGDISFSVVDTDPNMLYLDQGGQAIAAVTDHGKAKRYDNFLVSSLDNSVALVDGGTHDGSVTDYPGWFGYKAGDNIQAQNWTVDPNMATSVQKLIKISSKKVDDQLQKMIEVIMAAWQYELFASVLGTPRAQAGKNDINNLRDAILNNPGDGTKTMIDSYHSSQQDWILVTKLRFPGVKETMRSAFFSPSVLTSGNRYYGSPSDGMVSGWLVFRIEAVNSDDLGGVALLPVPPFGTVLFQRVFTAPQDLNFVWDNNPYRTRSVCFLAYFFNLMWEYSPPLELSAYLPAPSVPKIEVISVLSIDIQIRLDVISTEDTQSVTVEMSETSQFIGKVIRVKGGPLQSVYSLHIAGGPAAPIVGQYIRARRTDYLGSSGWSEIVYVSPDMIKNSTFLSSQGLGAVVSSPLNNLFTYVSDGTTITWSWAKFSLSYSDGFIQFIPAGTYTTFTGLSNSTTYKFYPYLQGTRQATATVVIQLSQVTNGTGDDPTAIAEAQSDGRAPLSRGAMTASTTSGGGGAGSGGGVG